MQSKYGSPVSADSGAPPVANRRGHAHHTEIQDLKQVGKDWCKLSVKRVIVGPVIVHLMFSRKPQAVGKKHCIIEHRGRRHDQAPDPITHIVTVDLRAGGKTAAEMSRKPHKRNP